MSGMSDFYHDEDFMDEDGTVHGLRCAPRRTARCSRSAIDVIVGDFVTACAAPFWLRDDDRDLSWQCSCELPEGHDGDHGIYGFSARDCICYPGMCPMECEPACPYCYQLIPAHLTVGESPLATARRQRA